MNANEIFSAMQQFDEEYIPFPPFVTAIDAIKTNLSLYRETKIPRHLLVLGESGAGKSSLCKWVKHQYPKFTLPDRDVTPVLVVSVPSGATISSVASSMLEQLGDPAAAFGTVSAKTTRVITLCRACQVEMLLFDEAQHIQDRGLAATHYKVGDWLKSLIDQTAIPTVLLGIPRLEELLRVNEQLRRRFSSRIRLVLGQDDKKTIHSECLQLFRSLGFCLPVPLSSGNYGWDDLAMRLYYASDGRVGYIKTLLLFALEFALENKVGEIDPKLLEQVFTVKIWQEGVGKLNPFNPAFVFRRLDRGNEPFEPGSLCSVRRGRREVVC